VGEGRLLTLKENLAVPGKPKPLVAVGDPSVIEFDIVGPRQLRIVGQRIGATDLAITTAEGNVYTFEVNVVADLNVLRCQLKALFPDASLKLGQLRDHVVVDGTARDTAQVAQILQTIRAYLISVQAQARKITGQSAAAAPGGARTAPPTRPAPGGTEPGPGSPGSGQAPLRPGPVAPAPADVYPEGLGQLSVSVTLPEPQIINLIRVPGSQQVLLKVRVAELNRTALREIGADFLSVDSSTGAIVGTQIGGAGIGGTGLITGKSSRGPPRAPPAR
jgi:pilus assembly protein CpaC